MAGSASVTLMTGGKKLDRKALRETISAQLQYTTESTASAGVFVDGKERKQNKVKIDPTKNVKQRAPGTAKERQERVLDRVLAKHVRKPSLDAPPQLFTHFFPSDRMPQS